MLRSPAFWRQLVRVAYRRVGGLHFLALGRITISWSVSSRGKPAPVHTVMSYEIISAAPETVEQRETLH